MSGEVEGLAIGGSRDGQFISGHKTLGVQFPIMPEPSTFIGFAAAPTNMTRDTLEFERYRYEWMRTSEAVMHFWVLEGLSITDVFRKLIDRYARS